jgi:hypothetical protein
MLIRTQIVVVCPVCKSAWIPPTKVMTEVLTKPDTVIVCSEGCLDQLLRLNPQDLN